MILSLRNHPVQACDSRAQGFRPPLARRRSSCPPPSSNLVRTRPIEHYHALRNSTPCLSRAATLRRAPNWSSEEARTWKHHPQPTIPPRHFSTDMLNRESSQLAASLEGEPGPTPAGKTLPHSYPETRFRRERARAHYRNHIVIMIHQSSAALTLNCPLTLNYYVNKSIKRLQISHGFTPKNGRRVNSNNYCACEMSDFHGDGGEPTPQ